MPCEVAAWRRDSEAQSGSGGAALSHGADGKFLRCRGHRRRSSGTHCRPLPGPCPLPGSVVEKDHFGGQITITSEVVNYPGVGRTSGTELTETMRKQAEGFGAEFLLAEVTGWSSPVT